MMKRIYNQASLFGPLYAYLIVISPPETIKADIAKIKKELNGVMPIGERNLHSIAHITLTDKLTDDSTVTETVSSLLTNQKPFKIKIKGWDIFDHGHSVTLYLRVENPAPVVHMMAMLKSASKSPHISLAKRISRQTYEALLPYLEDLNYSVEWQCKSVTVLRKLMSEKHLGFKDSFVIPLA